jgi:hypothetical protein
MGLRSGRGVFARITFCGLMLGALAAPACAQVFPTSGWLPLTQQGAILGDPDDSATLSPPGIDIVGNKTYPAAFVASDASYVYFRLRVAGDPYKLTPPSRFTPYSWVCLLDIDSDPQTYELSAVLDGIASPNSVVLEQNTSTGKPDSLDDPAEATLMTYTISHAQVPPLAATSSLGGATDYFADWAVDWNDLTAATPTALAKNAPFRIVCGTGTSEISLSGGDVLDNGSGSGSFSTDASDTLFCGDSGCQYDEVFKDGFEGP